MVKNQVFKKEYAFELLRIAKGDIETAEILLAHVGGRKENIIFISQQSIEKSLKAVLCFLGHPIPLTHSLELLLDRMPDKDFFEQFANLGELTEFATIRRYEEGSYDLSQDDLNDAVAISKKIFTWAELQIAKK